MSGEQRRVYDDILAGPRGTLVGPLRAALHSPELAERWQQLGAYLRYKTSLDLRLAELAILVTARRWSSQVEWHIHAQAALKAGLAPATVEAIAEKRPPAFEQADEAPIYEYARQLLELGEVRDETYDAVLSALGEVAIVELTALIGYYSMVAMTLNAHQIPLPEGAEPPFEPLTGAGRLASSPSVG